MMCRWTLIDAEMVRVPDVSAAFARAHRRLSRRLRRPIVLNGQPPGKFARSSRLA